MKGLCKARNRCHDHLYIG